MVKKKQTEEPRVADPAKIVFFILALLVFGLMAVFLFTTNQNSGGGTQSGFDSAKKTTAEQARDIQNLRETLEKNPNDVKTLIDLGFLYIDTSDMQNAEANFKKAVALSPKSVYALSGLGMAKQYQGRPNEALALFNKALKIESGNDFATVRKALLLAEAKEDYKTALELLRKVQAKQPEGKTKTELQTTIDQLEKKIGNQADSSNTTTSNSDR